MQLPIMDGIKVFATATAMTALGFITIPGPAAQADPTSCTLDSPVLTLDVTDGSVYTIDWSGTHPTGGTKSVYEGGKVKFGGATGPGVVPANPYPNIDFTINWGDVTNHITGQIDPVAGFAYGQVAKGGNNGGWTWSAQHEHWTCAANSTGGTQTAKTATVSIATDVYNAPDGNGQPYKNGDQNVAAQPGQVQLVGPELCKSNDWCHIVPPQGAGNPSWIYIGPGENGARFGTYP